MMYKYIIVVGRDNNDLQLKVNEFMGGKYFPLGSPYVMDGKVYQAMILKK